MRACGSVNTFFICAINPVAARALKKLRATMTYLLMTKVKFHSSAFIAGKLFYYPCVKVPRVCDQSFFD
jgi:hypothetical protein